MHRVRVLGLDFSELALVSILALRVLSIANLVVLKDALNVCKHELLQFGVVHGTNSPSVHLIQVESLQVDFLLLAVPFFGQSYCEGARWNRHQVFVHGLDNAIVESHSPVLAIAHRQVLKRAVICGCEFGQRIAVWMRHHARPLVEPLQVLCVRDLRHLRSGHSSLRKLHNEPPLARLQRLVQHDDMTRGNLLLLSIVRACLQVYK